MQLSNLRSVAFQGIQILQEEQPRCLFDVVQL